MGISGDRREQPGGVGRGESREWGVGSRRSGIGSVQGRGGDCFIEPHEQLGTWIVVQQEEGLVHTEIGNTPCEGAGGGGGGATENNKAAPRASRRRPHMNCSGRPEPSEAKASGRYDSSSWARLEWVKWVISAAFPWMRAYAISHTLSELKRAHLRPLNSS